MHSRHRCIRQEIADQINPICMLHIDGDEDLAAVQIGGYRVSNAMQHKLQCVAV